MNEIKQGFRSYRFVSLLNYHLKCKICDHVLRDATRLVCNTYNLHFFCKNCIFNLVENHEKNGEDFVCPVDKHIIKYVRQFISEDVRMQSKVNVLKIKCAFANNGCSQVLTVKEIDAHEEHCAYHNERLLKCGYCKNWFTKNERNCFSCFKSVIERRDRLHSQVGDIKVRLAKLNDILNKNKKHGTSQDQSNALDSVNNQSQNLVNPPQPASFMEISIESYLGQTHKFDESVCATCFGYLLKYVDFLEKKGRKVLKKLERFETAAKSLYDESITTSNDGEDEWLNEVCWICKRWNLSDDNFAVKDTWISCGDCNKWFHFGCTRYKDHSSGPEILQNFSFICDDCVCRNEE